MRRFPVPCAGVFVLLCLAAGRGAAAEARTVRVGVCLSLTGEFRQSGLVALSGIRMRVEEHNRRPDAGYRIDLVVRDDASDAATAAGFVGELAEKEGVGVIIGPASSNLITGMRDEARRLKTVLVSPSVTRAGIGRDRDWVFRILFDDEFQGVALARYLRHEMGVKRAAFLVNRRLAYAKSVSEAFKRQFEADGGTVVREEYFEWTAHKDAEYDFRPLLDRIMEEKPDAVLLPNNGTDIAEIIRQSLDCGTRPFFCGGDTWLYGDLLLAGGNNAEGTVFVSGVNYDSGTEAMQHFLKVYDESHDPAAQPVSVLGYDAASLVIEALRAGDDAEAIRDALYRLKDFELASGRITIDPGRGSEKSAYINKIVNRRDEFEFEVVGEVNP